MTSDHVTVGQQLWETFAIPEFVLMPLHQTAVSGVWKGANENYSH